METNGHIDINIFIFSFRLFFDIEKVNYRKLVTKKRNLIMQVHSLFRDFNIDLKIYYEENKKWKMANFQIKIKLIPLSVKNILVITNLLIYNFKNKTLGVEFILITDTLVCLLIFAYKFTYEGIKNLNLVSTFLLS